jgi:hypothetical protein
MLIENLIVCVLFTTVDCNLFNNHRNKKVVGGKHNVIVHYVDASAIDPEGVVLCNPFSDKTSRCVYTFNLNL